MKLPLANIKILDLTRLLPGPYCTMILADLGAKVIRIEEPNFSYPTSVPCYQKGNIKQPIFDTILMRNKESIRLNLKKSDERAKFLVLAQTADVIIEGFRPGITKKLGIDYNTVRKLNQQIIYCSLTGYGQSGPHSDFPSHDINFAGLSGNLFVPYQKTEKNQGQEHKPPQLPMYQISDISGGFYSAIGILGAIIERRNNSDHKGQYIDISMLDSAFAFNPLGIASVLANNLKSLSNFNGNTPNYTIYRTKDGKYMAIGSLEQKFWFQLCDTLGLSELKSQLNVLEDEKEKIYSLLSQKFSTKTQEEWKSIFHKVQACVSPVLEYSEAINHEQLRFRNMITEEFHPHFGKILNLGTPIKYSRTPLSIRKSAPLAGEDTNEILNEFQISK
ncbi:Formyl-CoA:oxalate CoA-transferase [Candidatus Lokiarchaeum ossiferum]|uniref:Formyl-CoA:oxalate CoA-transferase n=1 Tax=Candidatus Lokiarchaeum ossiferum TaxID=2951803 RepID=A0ABY6HTS0_9ARCH|nr:Formyl-CoA:oxalate CoA-transferase [Candidatus Lokiarchaeum sp. B-35]